jgi:putative addiction module CopG family antidote
VARRQSRNVSLAPAQDRFVEAMVAGGRFRTASEVVREGLRLLEDQEHRRLLEKWVYGGLTADQEASLPAALKERARAHFERLLDAATTDLENGDVTDGPTAMARLRAELEAHPD